MEELFLARQRIIGVYKLNEDKINIAARFLAGALVFYFLGSIAPEAGLSTKRMAAVVIGGVLGAISSPAVFLAVSALGAVLFIASVSVETAVVAFLLFFLLYVFYGRVFPRESLLFIAMLICFKFKVPYVVPILGGIYFGARAVFPSAAAMFVNQISSAVPELIKMSPVSEFSISTMPDTLFNMYTYIFTDGIK